MKTRWILTSAVVALATSSVAFGQAAGGGQGGAGGGRRGTAGGAAGADTGGRGGGFMRNLNGGNVYDEMTKAIASLSDEQKTKLKEKCDAMTKELDTFNQDARSRFTPGAGGNMRDEFQKLMDDRQKLVAEHQTQIAAVLTAEQRAEWETYKLNRDVTNRLNRAQLTDEQKTKILGLAKDAGKAISELKDPKDTVAITSEQGKLWKAVVQTVLTDEQAGKLMAPGLQMGMMPMGGFGGGGRGDAAAAGAGGRTGRGDATGGAGGRTGGTGTGGRGGRGGARGGAGGGGGNLP